MIYEKLKEIFSSDRLKLDAESLKIYGKDWSPYFAPKPTAIVFPKTMEEIQTLVRWANINKIFLVPSGGRTGLSGGATATQGEVVVCMDLMNQILDFSAADQSVKVQAGVVLEALQKFAAEKGLMYPIDFAARGSAQIGGTIATNAGGIKVLRYGMTRQWVLGLKVVTGSGEVLDLNRGLVKNATGYDLRQLFIGSEGTLGLIVEATLGLAAAPPPTQTILLATSGVDSIMKVFTKFKTQTDLVAFEMFSDLALSFVLADGHVTKPFETQSDYYLLLECGASTDESKAKMIEILEQCFGEGLVVDGVVSQSDKQARDFWRLREDISESLSKFSPYKNDLSVKISQAPSFMVDLDLILKKEYPAFQVVWFGHIGDGNLHINILKPNELPKEAFLKECRKVDELVFQTVQNHQGSISAEHGVGLVKKPFLHFSKSNFEIQFMKQIKAIFDPVHIMNPNKIFD